MENNWDERRGNDIVKICMNYLALWISELGRNGKRENDVINDIKKEREIESRRMLIKKGRRLFEKQGWHHP